MNDYTELKVRLELITSYLNNISNEEKNTLSVIGCDILRKLAIKFNKTNDLNIESLHVNQDNLILWIKIVQILEKYNEIAHNDLYEYYLQSIEDVFNSYSMDQRYFNLNKLKREIAVNGHSNIKYSFDLMNTFCNTATLLGLKFAYIHFIRFNESEGEQYIIQYLSDNYLSLQFKLFCINIEIK